MSTAGRTSGYRGRVRSGCLTCRIRKVKCDEVRPVCDNCRRLQRTCTYKPRKPRPIQHGIAEILNQDHVTPSSAEQTLVNLQESLVSSSTGSRSNPEPSYSERRSLGNIKEIMASYSSEKQPNGDPDEYPMDVNQRLEKALQDRGEAPPTPEECQDDMPSAADFISRDIELGTTMDLLAATRKRCQLFSPFFIESVECPGITPFDSVNWQLMKQHVVQLGSSCTTVALAMSAVAALHKAQTYGLTLSRAMSLYESAQKVLAEHLNDHGHDFSNELVAAFLLCMFELIVSGDITPWLKEPSGEFLARLATWSRHASRHADLPMRVVAWFRILHVMTMRAGGLGIIAVTVINLLPYYDGPLPSLKAPAGYVTDMSTHLYQILTAPLFDFYFRLQMLSGEIAALTHYHRSRRTGVDQEEVVAQITHIKSRLQDLWDSRCATQCQTASDIRAQLAPKVANHVISVIGICAAAYHAEIVEIDRVLGDPVTKFTDSRPSIRAIRDIVDGDWAQFLETDPGKLNPAYMRPLFMCAIECMNQAQNQWAVDRIAQIQNPIYRSNFFSMFGKALSDAQVLKERRVTSKYFCISFFGVPPPFM